MSNFNFPKSLASIDYCTYVKRLSKHGFTCKPDVDTDMLTYYSVDVFYYGRFYGEFSTPRQAYDIIKECCPLLLGL